MLQYTKMIKLIKVIIGKKRSLTGIYRTRKSETKLKFFFKFKDKKMSERRCNKSGMKKIIRSKKDRRRKKEVSKFKKGITVKTG